MSDPFRYPTGDLDRPERLLSLLGSFWSDAYQDETPASILYARARLDARALDVTRDLAAAVSRFEVAVFDSVRWSLVTLRRSDRTDPPALPDFDGTLTFSPTNGARFGDPAPGNVYPAPPGLVRLPLLCNRFTSPSLVLVGGVDFTLGDGRLVFRDDPFASPFLPSTEIWDDSGAVVDREVTLWAPFAAFDRDNVYTQFGYAAGVVGTSSERYRDLVNAVYDAATLGTTTRHLQAFFSAALGVDFVRGDVETVQDVFTDARGVCIVTDAGVYRYPGGSTPAVAVGDVLAGGDPLVDTVLFDEFNTGKVPVGLRALAAPGTPDLVFEAGGVPLAVSTVDGRTYVSFPLGGDPAAAAAFWDAAHANGVASGTTLARYLDVRGPAAPSEPTADSLPATVDPLAFLCANALRDNVTLVRVKPVGVDDVLGGFAALRSLRKMVPPASLLIVLVEWDFSEGPVTLDGPGDVTRFGYSESASAMPAQAVSETWDLSGTPESVRARYVTDPCQGS